MSGNVRIPVLRNVLLRHALITSGPLDIRIEYVSATGSLECDLGEYVDGAWRWYGSREVPEEVCAAAYDALCLGTSVRESDRETGDEARAALEAFYDREIGADPVLAGGAR